MENTKGGPKVDKEVYSKECQHEQCTGQVQKQCEQHQYLLCRQCANNKHTLCDTRDISTLEALENSINDIESIVTKLKQLGTVEIRQIVDNYAKELEVFEKGISNLTDEVKETYKNGNWAKFPDLQTKLDDFRKSIFKTKMFISLSRYLFLTNINCEGMFLNKIGQNKIEIYKG